MTILITLEIICLFCVFVSIFSLVTEKEKSESLRRIKILSILSCIWLFSDAFTYIFNRPETNYWASYGLVHFVQALTYVLTNIVAMGFIYYAEAYICDKTNISKLFFRVPMLVMIVNAIIDIVWYCRGKLVVNDGGTFTIIGTPPAFVLISYVLALVSIPVIAVFKKKDLGIRAVSLFASCCLPIGFAILVLLLENIDFSVVVGAITVVIVARILQNDLKQTKLVEALTFTNYFLGTYLSAYYVDLNTLNYTIYKRSKDIQEKYPILTSYFDSLGEYINTDVHPDDREKLLEMVRPDRMKAKLIETPDFYHLFRDISNGTEKIYKLQVIRGADENHAAFGFIDVSLEMHAQNEREAARKLIDGIISEYNLAYSVNLENDTFERLCVDDDIVGKDEEFECFSQALDYFINQIVIPSDRERMIREVDYDGIRERIVRERSYDVEYRALIHGKTVWHEMNITYIDKDVVAIGFVQKDLEITKRHLEEKRYDEYFALFAVDIDTGLIKTVKNLSEYATGKAGEATSYSKEMLAFARGLGGEAKGFFERISDIEFVKNEFMYDDKRTYTYKSQIISGDKWIEVTSYVILRHEDGTPAMFTLGFSIVDTLATASMELQSKLNEDMQMIGGLASEYHTLYFYNISENLFKIYTLDGQKYPELKNLFKVGENPAVLIQRFGTSELVHPDDRKQFENIDIEYLLENLAHKKRHTIRFRRKYNEDYRWLEMDMVKYEDENDTPNSIIIGFALRDEMIRREMEQQKELEEAYNAAEAANKSKTNFLFNMSHDIRTPMNAINGFTTMAKKYVDDKERVTQYLEKIDISGKQLLALINQVLEMARIESGLIEIENRPVSIKGIFTSMVTVISEQAKSNGQIFNFSLENIEHEYVFADEARLDSITLNVTGNAMKYTPEGGTIDFSFKEIECEREGFGRFVFTCTDTGIGMSEEFQKELFVPFAREKNSTVSRIQGTGLGMTIVKNLVDAMGGSIEVSSKVGKGTTFVITLELEIDKEHKQINDTGEAGRISFEGCTVLVVEDNEMNREIAKDLLEEYGMVVEEAEDGFVAVELIEKLLSTDSDRLYDAILMDVQMPRMSGYEAAGKIRQIVQPKGIHIPIIAMTANAFAEDRQDALDAGMDEHIAKPIDVEKLLSTLAVFLGK